MRRLDDLRRDTAPSTKREAGKTQIRLGMPWGHVDDQALEGAVCDLLKGFGHQLVVPAMDEGGPHIPDEVHEIGSGVLDALGFFDFVEKLRSL